MAEECTCGMNAEGLRFSIICPKHDAIPLTPSDALLDAPPKRIVDIAANLEGKVKLI